MIDSFAGEYRFLSNFWPAPVLMYGELYPSVEHAYQAAKCKRSADRAAFRDASLTPGQAKRLGRTVEVRDDWEAFKITAMNTLVRRKFEFRLLADRLLATGDQELVEGNKWGDTFWGVCNGRGENHLGKILMATRKELA